MKVANLFGVFNNSVRSMQHSQHAISVHGQNVAHANDKDYTRRDVLSFDESRLGGPGIARLRDSFVDDQFRRASGSLGDAEIRQNVMGKIEDIFGDPVNGGLRKAIDGFFDSWQAVAENPADGVARIQVITAGNTFAHEIRSTYAKLQAVEQTVNEELTSHVGEVNSLLENVFTLNKRISDLSRNSMDDAGLRDERDVIMDKLAKLVGATAVEQPDSTVRVIVGSTVVVDGPSVIRLNLVTQNGQPTPSWTGYVNPVFAGKGTIAGLVSARDGELKQLKAHIDDLGRKVGKAVNDQQALGYPMGGGAPIPFFQYSAAPADLTVNPNITPATLAAAGNSAGLQSDGDNARKIAAVADMALIGSPLISGQLQNPRMFYRNLVGWIGTRGEAANQDAEIAQIHVRVNEDARQSKSGVSLDEEVARLTMQQKSFEAAARVIGVIDEMMDTLINRTGR